jgi:hypothetical protein
MGRVRVVEKDRREVSGTAAAVRMEDDKDAVETAVVAIEFDGLGSG